MRGSLQERFDAKYEPVTESGCWLWTGSVSPKGYGSLGKDGEVIGAHRISYELHKGVIPKGIFVLHTCDVPSCVNPDHLFLGTHQDNMEDRRIKGKTVKMNKKTVAEMRKLYQGGATQTLLADMYGIHQTQVSNICCNKQWINNSTEIM